MDVDPLLDFRNKFICGDSIEIMKKLPDKSIDLIVTSPPYNLRNSSGNGMRYMNSGKWKNPMLANGYTNHTDDIPHEEYVRWQRECLTEMMRLLKSGGAIFYNHKWRVQKGLIQDRNDIVNGFPVRQIIIWRRKGGLNFNVRFFLPTYEVIYLIATPQFKLTPKSNAHGDVWEFKQELNNPHPAPFPVDLIKRIISSTYSSIVLDPFMGSGTTAVAARECGIDFIGIDNSEEYCEMAKKRVDGLEWRK